MSAGTGSPLLVAGVVALLAAGVLFIPTPQSSPTAPLPTPVDAAPVSAPKGSPAPS